jgi:hypothetical protein
MDGRASLPQRQSRRLLLSPLEHLVHQIKRAVDGRVPLMAP